MAGWTKTLGSETGTSQILDLPHLSLILVRLDTGERQVLRTGKTEETAVVFASGRCAATADGRFWANCGTALAVAPWMRFAPKEDGRGRAARPRRRISAEFRPLASTSPWPLHQALWLPPDAQLELQALEPAEVLLVATDLGEATRQAAGRTPELYGPGTEASREVGSGAYRRLVTPLLTPGAESVALALGETYNPPGSWSTYPPHRHDRRLRPFNPDDGGETAHEEVYVFRFAPVGGFGLARIYDAGATATGGPPADQALVFRHAEALAILQGFHTVAAAPGYHLHYLWALAGPVASKPENRADPAHAWVEEEA